jgi:hypothetical protein
MKTAGIGVALLSLATVLAAVPASAGTLYSNGPANDQTEAWTINFGFAVTDSFTLTQASTITGATFDVWNGPGDSLSSVDWSIGTVAFGGAAATATTSDVFDFSNSWGYDIYTDSISIPSLTLGAGTYFFTLQNAVTVDGQPGYWDQNSGPSNAFENDRGQVPSETFSITGNAAATPEPSSLLLLGSGLAGVAGMLRRKIKA